MPDAVSHQPLRVRVAGSGSLLTAPFLCRSLAVQSLEWTKSPLPSPLPLAAWPCVVFNVCDPFINVQVHPVACWRAGDLWAEAQGKHLMSAISRAKGENGRAAAEAASAARRQQRIAAAAAEAKADSGRHGYAAGWRLQPVR